MDTLEEMQYLLELAESSVGESCEDGWRREREIPRE